MGFASSAKNSITDHTPLCVVMCIISPSQSDNSKNDDIHFPWPMQYHSGYEVRSEKIREEKRK
jgi:hypothetical protein